MGGLDRDKDTRFWPLRGHLLEKKKTDQCLFIQADKEDAIVFCQTWSAAKARATGSKRGTNSQLKALGYYALCLSYFRTDHKEKYEQQGETVNILALLSQQQHIVYTS